MMALLHLVPARVCGFLGVFAATEMLKDRDHMDTQDHLVGGVLVTIALAGAAISISEALSFAIGTAIAGAR